jgi:hypothetical protein
VRFSPKKYAVPNVISHSTILSPSRALSLTRCDSLFLFVFIIFYPTKFQEIFNLNPKVLKLIVYSPEVSKSCKINILLSFSGKLDGIPPTCVSRVFLTKNLPILPFPQCNDFRHDIYSLAKLTSKALLNKACMQLEASSKAMFGRKSG